MKLKMNDLSVGYAGKAILSNFSAIANSGEILCLLGPNGVGKTTLFKSVLRLMPLLSGHVTIDGKNVDKMSSKEFAQYVAYVPQAHVPPFAYYVKDVIVIGRIAHLGLFGSPTVSDYELADEIMEKLGIAHLADRIYTELSGGERQMVLIARALIQQPYFLMMDEPTSNLDYGNQVTVIKTIRKLAKDGLGIIMTTHNPNHLFLSEGKGILIMPDQTYVMGSGDEILTTENLRRAYNVDVLVNKTQYKGTELTACYPIIDDL